MSPTSLETRLRTALERLHQGSSDYDLTPDVALPEGRVLRPAAALVAIRPGPDGAQVTLTRRAPTLKHHPGQIAFPGGKCDPTDQNVQQTALREAREEIGLPGDNVQILGQMPGHETVTGFHVIPVVALLQAPFSPQPDPREVAEVFTVPLAHLLNIGNYSVQGRYWRGGQRHYYTVPYGPYYIWGATARMLHALASGMAP